MTENLNLILIIVAFTLLLGWSFFDLMKRTKRNKKFAEKNNGDKIDKEDEIHYGLQLFTGIIDMIKKIF